MSTLSLEKRFAPAMAWAEIDLRAVEHNFCSIQKKAGSAVKILCVVKANAYGHDSRMIAKVLERKGVDFLGISDLHEGILLRKSGIQAPILMVENTLPEHAKYLTENNITPILCTLKLARALNALGARKRKKIAVHVKVDTGMGRLGVALDDAFLFVKALLSLPWISIEGVCTHFPLADSNQSFTYLQIRKFLKLVNDLRTIYSLAIPFVHAANSMGLVAYDKKGFSLARVGLMIYGMYPNPRIKSKISLRPVMSIKSRITFLKEVEKGQGISYGHRFIAPRPLKVATVAIGYHDGYLRVFSNMTDVLIAGKRCSVIGTVTMDQIMVDVSALKSVKIGDEVCVLGRQGKQEVSADELARIAGTINYEITCCLGSRLPAFFKGELKNKK